MNIRYTARQVEMSDGQRKKLEAKFQRIQKVLGRWQDAEVHVIVSSERRRYRAEVAVNYRHHALVVECLGADPLQAMQDAVEKLEKQIIRDKDRSRERKRRPGRRGLGAIAPAL